MTKKIIVIATQDFLHGAINAFRGKSVEGLSQTAIKDLAQCGLVTVEDSELISQEQAAEAERKRVAQEQADEAERKRVAQEQADEAERKRIEPDKSASNTEQKLAPGAVNKMAEAPSNKGKGNR